MELSTFFQQLANALSLGSLYALIAIGYTMVYGILRLINFAHGDVFMLGAYFAFYAISAPAHALVDGLHRRHRPYRPLRHGAGARGVPARSGIRPRYPS